MAKNTKPWEAEHGKGYDIPAAIEWLVSKKILTDSSWHNDVAPSFMIADPAREDYGLRIWVDHPLQSLREVPGSKRFILQEGEFGTESDFEFETDDLEEVLLKLFQRATDSRYRTAEISSQDWFSEDSKDTMHEFIQALTRR